MFKKVLAGIALFTGYGAFTASMKLTDFFIQSSVSGSESQGLLATGLTVLISLKLLVTFLGGIVIGKLASDKLTNNVFTMFALGCIVIAAGVTVGDWGYLIAGKALCGVGGGAILASMSPLTASIFTGKTLSVVNGTNNAAPNVGITAVILLSPVVMLNLSASSQIIAGLAGVSAVIMVVLAVTMDTIPPEPSENGSQSLLFGFKSPFNLLFASSFSFAVAFFTLSFTFLDSKLIEPFLLTAIAGNFAGTYLASKFNHKKTALVLSIIGALSAIPFLVFSSSIFAMVCGFSIFASIASYVNIAFGRNGVTPASLGVTFMLLWVFNDLFVIGAGIIFESLASDIGKLFLASLVSLYALGVMALNLVVKRSNVALQS